MALPKLQIALDTLTTKEAIDSVQKVLKYIDVIEVGTILISSEGKKAIKELKKEFPNKIIVADGKIADAARTFGKMFYDNGADYITAICAAETATINELVKLANEYKSNKEVQVEMTSHFTWNQVEEWKKIGVTQVVWHRARDAQAAGQKWNENDIHSVAKLANMGFKVTVTGGVSLDDIKLFKNIPVFIFIVGRVIRNAKEPEKIAKAFQDEFKKYWK